MSIAEVRKREIFLPFQRNFRPDSGSGSPPAGEYKHTSAILERLKSERQSPRTGYRNPAPKSAQHSPLLACAHFVVEICLSLAPTGIIAE